MKIFLPYIFLIILPLCVSAKNDSSLIVSIDPPICEGKEITQRINYKSVTSSNVVLRVKAYMLNNSDSDMLYDLEYASVKIEKGVNSIDLLFNNNTKLYYANYSFWEVVKRFKVLPPGNYVTYIEVTSSELPKVNEYSLWYFDSALSHHSPIRAGFNNELAYKNKETKFSNTGIFGKRKINKQTHVGLSKRLNQKVAKKHGAVTKPVTKNEKQYTAVYYKQWFLGYYEVMNTPALKKKATKEKALLDRYPEQFVSNDLENFTSLSNQHKVANKKKEERELTGTIGLFSYLSTGQEYGAMQDNNYQEVYTSLNTEILNMPVVIEGYYTTQDIKRSAKSSYVRISYDTDKRNSELSNSVNSYKSIYTETQSKGKGININYLQTIKGLLSRQEHDAFAFKQKYGVDLSELEKYDGDIDMMSIGADKQLEDGKLNKLRENIEDVRAYYNRSKENRKKIEKYRKLLAQFERQQYFDSALAYGKIRELEKKDIVTTKKLAQAADYILPKRKKSSFLNSLTRLEVGILNNYESDYTMSGQTLKGGTVGYDLGSVIVSGALGNTEYISREGYLDRYNTTMLRVDLHPSPQRKLGLVYYTCSPSRQMLKDTAFFSDFSGVPSFESPVHILSVPYEVQITKNLAAGGEAAVSHQQGQHDNKVSDENAAYRTELRYLIPSTSITTSAEWEHVGSDFENNALPFPKAATDRYTLASEALFFKGFLKTGVQFNYLSQETFSSSGRNIKWGFDVKTNSRRYPNVFISYKPFSTFRKVDDTLAIAQRPVVGSVWIVRGSYQLRSLYSTHRFMLLYNRNASVIEDLDYKSKTIQGSYVLSDKKNVVSLNVGWMSAPIVAGVGSGELSSYIFNVSYSRSITEQFDAIGAQNLSIADFGVQRVTTTLGGVYTIKNKPLKIRLTASRTVFQINELTKKEKIWSCQIGCNWRLK